MADRSATVLFTTHSVEDLAQCDRIVFMATRRWTSFVGTVDEALEEFRWVDSVTELYRRLADARRPTPSADAVRQIPSTSAGHVAMPTATGPATWSGSPWRQRVHAVACADPPDVLETLSAQLA